MVHMKVSLILNDMGKERKRNEMLKQIRDLMHRDCPVIRAGNWAAMTYGGWRQADTIDITDIDMATATIKDYQMSHGPENVALGHPINKLTLKPQIEPGKMGVYVCDTESLVSELQKSLNDLDEVERWLATNG